VPAVPEHIGKYQISQVLGQGAMGVVYKGFDPHIQRLVAIKTIHKSLLGDPDVNAEQDSIAARFRNEAQAVGRIAHPGVVAIYEFGEDETTAYIAMEFVEGRNLDHVLAGTPMLSEAQVLRIMDQLLDALAAAHDQGVWHRDIKPANLLLTASGQVKLTDFGIARIAGLGLTQVNSAIGTPGYMAPEQYIGEGIDQRADIFACGVLLYRLLTGKPAFVGSAEQVMYKILNETPAAPSTVTQRPPHYDAVVARAMSKRVEDRYPDARAMRAAIQAASRGEDSPSDDATVIAAQPWQRAVEAAKGSSPRPSGATGATGASGAGGASGASGAGSNATQLAHWDAQTLSRIERALATHVGPMAKLMVRDAAKSCEDVVSLATAVSQHIADAAKRAAFMSAATAGSQATQIASSSATRMGQRLDEGLLARATSTLTRNLGPIAKVVVRKACEASGGDAGRFIEALLAAVPEGDRAAVQKDLGA